MEQLNPSFKEIGLKFVEFYYPTFDNAATRPNLSAVYQPHSFLTFEGEQYQGTEAIIKKLTSMPFKTVAHQITTCDFQPMPMGGIGVFVMGQLKTDNDPAHSFSQTFSLYPLETNNAIYYIKNDMFRLTLHHG